MDLTKPLDLDAGGTDLAAIIEEEGGRVEIVPAEPDSIPTHRIVPIDIWRRMFDRYLDRGQVAIRRGLEIDRLKRHIAKLEAE